MSQQEESSATGHLDYYKAHGISPVRYDVRDLDAHFDRRDSLYRQLGLPLVAFKGCDVLEVAPGSGQNSLYIAAACPARYDLVEPNPTAVRDIEALYAAFDRPHTAPRLHATRLQEFEPRHRYDVVLCENWLGSLPQERALLRKLAGFLAPGGVLVLTIVPPTGFFPNVVRKLLALRLLPTGMPFDEQTSWLTEIFGPHLATIHDMTRSHHDWVQDCLLNPHYLNVALPLDTVLGEIGSTVEILGSVPSFASDWRWFKGLFGEARRFNETFRRNHLETLHNLVDYRRVWAPRPAAENETLAAACDELHRAALAWQADRGASPAILAALERLAGDLGRLDAEIGRAVAEARDAWAAPTLEPARVRDMEHFGGLFGRETVYLSCTAAR